MNGNMVKEWTELQLQVIKDNTSRELSLSSTRPGFIIVAVLIILFSLILCLSPNIFHASLLLKHRDDYYEKQTIKQEERKEG